MVENSKCKITTLVFTVCTVVLIISFCLLTLMVWLTSKKIDALTSQNKELLNNIYDIQKTNYWTMDALRTVQTHNDQIEKILKDIR